MTKLLPLLAGLLILTACGRSGGDAAAKPATETNNYSSGNPVTAPVDYLGAVSKGQRYSQATISVANTTQAIQLFNAAEGRYPKDLEELVAENYLAAMPTAPSGKKIVYDAATGTVKVENVQ